MVGIELYNSLLLFAFENTVNNKINKQVEEIILEDINELLKASIYEKLKVKNPDSITNNTDILINKFERIYAEIKNDKRNSLIISGNYGIQNYKDIMFQIKHYAGTTNYNFNLSNFPESCD